MAVPGRSSALGFLCRQYRFLLPVRGDELLDLSGFGRANFGILGRRSIQVPHLGLLECGNELVAG